jgi:hypothetical protein
MARLGHVWGLQSHPMRPCPLHAPHAHSSPGGRPYCMPPLSSTSPESSRSRPGKRPDRKEYNADPPSVHNGGGYSRCKEGGGRHGPSTRPWPKAVRYYVGKNWSPESRLNQRFSRLKAPPEPDCSPGGLTSESGAPESRLVQAGFSAWFRRGFRRD